MRTDRIPPLLDGRALARLLDAELDFDPVAEHGFTNHLAMGLVAAARLGADPDTLQRWYDDEATGGFIHRRTPARRVWTRTRRRSNASGSTPRCGRHCPTSSPASGACSTG